MMNLSTLGDPFAGSREAAAVTEVPQGSVSERPQWQAENGLMSDEMPAFATESSKSRFRNVAQALTKPESAIASQKRTTLSEEEEAASSSSPPQQIEPTSDPLQYNLECSGCGFVAKSHTSLQFHKKQCKGRCSHCAKKGQACLMEYGRQALQRCRACRLTGLNCDIRHLRPPAFILREEELTCKGCGHIAKSLCGLAEHLKGCRGRCSNCEVMGALCESVRTRARFPCCRNCWEHKAKTISDFTFKTKVP
jgi:hypothetical protein